MVSMKAKKMQKKRKTKQKKLTVVSEVEGREDMSGSEEEPQEEDSDEELASAFARGELKPGLNALLPFARKEVTNNVPGLKKKAQELQLDFSWIERLDLVNGPAKMSPELNSQYGDLALQVNRKGEVSGLEKEDKAQHDFKREMLFYRQAQESVLEGLSKLKKLGIPTKRPVDYFAQMVKTDEHMKKVRENLLNKQESIDRSEKAKKQRDLKKMGKQVQQEVLKKRAKEKREMLDKVKKIKGGKEEAANLFKDTKKVSKRTKQKLVYKNDKYGYGGPKKRGKYNTADSAAEVPTFGRKKKGQQKGSQRPGKNSRQRSKK